MSAREHSWCPHVAGHRTYHVYDGTKMSYQKDTEDKDDRSFRTSSKAKAEEIQEIDRRASKEHEEAKKEQATSRHTQRAGNALESL